jgi:hypothetical protein
VDIGTVKNNLTAGIFEAYSIEGIEIPQMDINIKEIKPKESGRPTMEQNITT